MALPKRTLDRRISETTLRKGLARLKPPTDTMLLDKDMLKVSRKLDVVLKRGGNRTREVQRLLDGFASSSTPVMHTRGGSVASSMFFRDRNTIFEILNGLYLPTDTPAFYVPAARRYYDDKIVTGALGSASAYKNNGKLTTIQSLDLNAAKESTWAAVFIYFSTDIANYGQVSRITFQPNIEWSFHDTMDSNPVWTDRVAHLDGWVWFNGYVWLAGYEFNIATNKFEDLSAPSAISYPVAQSTWWVSELGASNSAGSLRDGAATFKFIASPARTYALGVWIQLRAAHSVKNAQGGPIPQPGPGDFTEYALFKAEVPEMWLSHEVLAK